MASIEALLSTHKDVGLSLVQDDGGAEGCVSLKLGERKGVVRLAPDDDTGALGVELDVEDDDSDCDNDDLMEAIVVKLDDSLRASSTTDMEEAVRRLITCCQGDGRGDGAAMAMEGDAEYLYDDGGGAASTSVDPRWMEERDLRDRLQARDKALRQVCLSTFTTVGSKRRYVENCSSSAKEKLYSSNASFGILLNDLLRLRKAAHKLGYQCEAVDDNIYKWRITMHRFRADSPLFMDMTVLEDTFDYSHVEIEMDFAMDLHPVYPPVVSIVRPRFEGFMLGRIATLPILQLSNWSEVYGVDFLLASIREVLERDGRIYLDSALNDSAQNPHGAYSALERSLLRLGLVTETNPRILLLHDGKVSSSAASRKPMGVNLYSSHLLDHAMDTVEQAESVWQSSSSSSSSSSSYSTPSAPSSSSHGKRVVVGDKLVTLETLPPPSDAVVGPGTDAPPKKSGGEAWAKGTGYGRSSSSKWNTKEFHAAQCEKDRLHRDLLQSVRNGLCEVFLRSRSDSASSSDSTNTSSVTPIDSLENTFTVVADSCLVPLLEDLLGNESFVDMERHKDIYVSAYRIVELIASSSVLFPLLQPLERQAVSLMTLLERKHKKLGMYLAKDKADAAAADYVALGLPKLPAKHVPSSKAAGEAVAHAPPAHIPVPRTPTIDDDLLVGDLFVFLHTVAEKVVTSPFRSYKSSRNPRTQSASKHVSGMEPNNKEGTAQRSCDAATNVCDMAVPEVAAKEDYRESQESLQKQYKSVMAAMQYDELDELYRYRYADSLPTSSTAKRRKRIRQEHYDIQGSLPVEWSSSVWVRYCAHRLDTLQALISGPEDTPYSNGLFLFDILFPEEYPAAAPKVTIQTTGSGTVRFNPNLYSNGKVCLSLLGTWSGRDGETWDEKTSTLLQVLVSIQSLILVSDPYFNEPGYEGTISTAKGLASSNKYNMTVRTDMVRWAMLDHLRHPKTGYEEITRTHFRMKAIEIKAQFEQWRADDTTRDAPETAKAELETAMADVAAALDDLA